MSSLLVGPSVTATVNATTDYCYYTIAYTQNDDVTGNLMTPGSALTFQTTAGDVKFNGTFDITCSGGSAVTITPDAADTNTANIVTEADGTTAVTATNRIFTVLAANDCILAGEGRVMVATSTTVKITSADGSVRNYTDVPASPLTYAGAATWRCSSNTTVINVTAGAATFTAASMGGVSALAPTVIPDTLKTVNFTVVAGAVDTTIEGNLTGFIGTTAAGFTGTLSADTSNSSFAALFTAVLAFFALGQF